MSVQAWRRIYITSCLPAGAAWLALFWPPDDLPPVLVPVFVAAIASNVLSGFGLRAAKRREDAETGGAVHDAW